MKVLGIETSCDETGIAVYDSGRGLLAHALHSQIDVHTLYGGVVPELASRDHIQWMTPLLRDALDQAAISIGQIDCIAYTAGPGLAGALLVGASTAKALAWSLSVPSVAVHHMEGHLLAPLLESEPPDFPFVCLLVSGGHTMLIRVEGVGQYELLGETQDDAAGEAFDKTAKMLGLGYPGGPRLAEAALQGDAGRFRFSRPMTNRPGLAFSFSGLKTAAMTAFAETSGSIADKADIAAGFQAAVVDTLRIKCQRALQQVGMRRLVVAGGVGANQCLRETFTRHFTAAGTSVHYPRIEYCTDNGAMIALVGCLRLQQGEISDLSVPVRPRWPLHELRPPGL